MPRLCPALLLLLLTTPTWPQASKPSGTPKPQAGDPHPGGEALYRSNCAFCHGVDGGGGRGSRLNGKLVHGDAPDTIKRIVQNGIPGTQMPAFDSFEESDLNRLVAHVRSFSRAAGTADPVNGDAARGQQLYASTGCANCHRIGQEGSVYGPELTRIGAARSLSYLRESLIHPSADIPPEYEGVTAVLPDGSKVRGVRMNEDSFTVQLRTFAQRFRSFDKSALREVVHEKTSLMPAYEKLSPADLDNLLAYLQGLRGAAGSSGVVDKAKGIH